MVARRNTPPPPKEQIPTAKQTGRTQVAVRLCTVGLGLEAWSCSLLRVAPHFLWARRSKAATTLAAQSSAAPLPPLKNFSLRPSNAAGRVSLGAAECAGGQG